VQAEGGVGPDGDIVAYSQVCQHLGCIYAFIAPGSSPSCDSSYLASGPVGYCCCHGSVYDLANAAKVVGGPAPRPVPMVILSYDSATGNIYATGMTPPTIFGYDTGSNDVSDDLQGGTLVS
jgi:arsenite oxidase small subunit